MKSMILTNPLGLLALLGIPAVILIHFFQRQAKVVPISTLFLLEQTQRESTSGRRFDRLTHSVPLWLQLLMVLLLTWFLVEPRYQKAASTQQVAIVLDSSASMSVFKEKLSTSLADKLPDLQGPATRLQLYLLESDAAAPVLYTGDEIDDLIAVIDEWNPTAGAIDPTASLRLARSRIRREGILIYCTDEPLAEDDSLPFDTQLMAVGESRQNLGFTGLAFDDETGAWQATVRNYSDERATRTWEVEFPDGSRSEARELALEPNALTTLSGTFPEGVEHITVRLEEDAFQLDDVLPIVRPQPKTLAFWSLLPPKFRDFQSRFLSFFPLLESTNDASLADLALSAYDPLMPELPETNSVITINETARSRKYLAGGIVAEPHALMEGLNWQALQARETVPFTVLETDNVLLWQGTRPLIVLRELAATEETGRATQHLIFNFDLNLSNALKLPSTVILLHRFTSGILADKVAFEARNTETGQPLTLASNPGLPLSLQFPEGELAASALPSSASLQAPKEPGFYQIAQDGEVLLNASAYFADTREADLRNCASADRVSPLSAAAIDINTEEDHLWPIWIGLTMAALLTAWAYSKQRKEAEVAEPSATAA
ncbi:MAG: BatA domain-containing protein [Verrucomicrobiota bacterium JB023]|nr:BatA domain-containing protein [Verrucomicrobiota bacterium JB023]